MNHQQKLDDEITKVQSAIMAMLSESPHSCYQQLKCELLTIGRNDWLDHVAQKLGPEYTPLINRMTQLEAAISQIDIGQYGYCCDCEKEIPATLLAKDPAAQRCDKCAK